MQGALGDEIAPTFIPLTTEGVYTKDTTSTYPLLDVQSSLYVVSLVSASNGVGGTLTTTYKYGGLKAEVGTGRGLLGFAWIESTQAETGLVTRTDYRQDWPYVGLPSKVKQSLSGAGNGGVLSRTTHTYGYHNLRTVPPCVVASGQRYLPYLSASSESTWDLDGTALPIRTTGQEIDLYGNPTQVTVTASDGHQQTTTHTYQNDTAHRRLGRRQRSQVQRVAP